MLAALSLVSLFPLAAAGGPAISVFGHKVPDTDAISAALVYAWELGERNFTATAYRLGELNPETSYVLKTLGVDLPPLLKELQPKGTVAIVDTSNPAELPDGISKAPIHSIVDHHKLSGLSNSEPLEVDMRPLCSAGSILYARAKAAGRTPPKQIAGLMLSSIISDSLEFRSPTTTEIDRVYAAELGKLAGLDVHAHAEAMLEAKAQVDHLSPDELVMMDTKIFNIGGKKLRVSVLETTKPAAPLAKKDALVAAQKALVQKEALDDMLFFVVDILKEEATFISASPSASRIVEKAWKVSVDKEGKVVLPGVLSRKKQMIPALEAAAPFSEPACDDKTGVCTPDAGKPHGGKLVSAFVDSEAERSKLAKACTATIELSERQACDVALLITGAFSPLQGFMKSADYDGVVSGMRTADGTLFGLPVVLDVTDASLQGKKVLLRYKGTDMAVLEAEEVWKPNKVKEAQGCYGTTSSEHPSVLELFADLGKYYVGGKVHGLVQGFEAVWGKGFRTPAEVRATLPAGKPVVAFQNRNPVHKAHFELLVNAKEAVANSIVFVHPTCGPTQPGDIDGPTRIMTYEVMQEDPFYKKWAGDAFRWGYLPYSMKMAGPREAIQHMIIRKNFGATHFIIGRDMAGTKSTLTSEDFYGAYDAQQMGEKHMGELAMNVAKFENMVYVGEEHGNVRGYTSESDAKSRSLKIAKLSGTEFRKRLRSGDEIPEWFAFPAVVKTLRDGGDAIFL